MWRPGGEKKDLLVDPAAAAADRLGLAGRWKGGRPFCYVSYEIQYCVSMDVVFVAERMGE